MSKKILASPISPSSFDKDVVYENIDEDTIEYNLINNLFIPYTKIIVKEDDDEVYVKYIICSNKYGDIIVIEMDNADGNVSTNELDIFVKEVENLDFPESLINGNISGVSNDVDGVFMISKKGICVTTFDEYMEIKVNYYSFTKNININDNFDISNCPISYIIIKYQSLMEFLSNEEENLNIIISESINKLKVDSMLECKKNINIISEKLTKIKDEYYELCENLYEDLRKKDKKINKLKRNVDNYKDKNDLAMNVNKLANINEKIINIIETINSFNENSPLINRLLNEVNKLTFKINNINERECSLIRNIIVKHYNE